MTKTFGQGQKFWEKGHNTPSNGIALVEPLHRRFHVGSLPNLAKENAKNQDHTGTKHFLFISKDPDEGFKGVYSFFSSHLKNDVKHAVSSLSNLKNGIQEQLQDKLSRFYLKTNDTNKEVISQAIKHICQDDCTLRIVHRCDKPLSFYTICGLQARALRVLGHEDFKELKNGIYHGNDDFCELDTNSSRSLPDAEERQALLRRACHDSAVAAGLWSDSTFKQPRKRKHCGK